MSCAGGIRTKGKLPVTREERTNGKAMQIKISGLKGGHSGMDIIKERGNSNKILGRILKHLLNNVEYSLCEMNGGSKNNAIPREAEAVIMVADGDLVKAKELVLEFAKLVKNELKAQDAGLNIEVQEVAAVSKVFTKESTEKAVNLLYLYPSGIYSKSTEIEGLVESSTNLGVLTTTEGFVEYDSAVRSSVPSLKEEIVLRSKTIVNLLGGELECTSGYPAWEYNPDSKIREICQSVHKEMYGKEAEIVAIHAGVECGLFNEKLGNLDMISFGPNLYDVHTPEEHMSISSVKNCYEYLLNILKAVK